MPRSKPRRRRRPRYPRALEGQYQRLLLSRVRAVAALTLREIRAVLDVVATDSLAGEARFDNIAAAVAVERILRVVAQSVALSMPAPVEAVTFLGTQLDLFAQRQVSKSVESVIAISVADHAALIEAWAADNVAFITSLDTRYFADIAEVVSTGYAEGLSTRSILGEIQARTGASESRARLIARDQIGNLNAKATQQRQADLGIERYIWRTSGDQRVRPEHEERDGVEFRWSDPPSDGHPGEPIQCRCTAIAVL